MFCVRRGDVQTWSSVLRSKFILAQKFRLSNPPLLPTSDPLSAIMLTQDKSDFSALNTTRCRKSSNVVAYIPKRVLPIYPLPLLISNCRDQTDKRPDRNLDVGLRTGYEFEIVSRPGGKLALLCPVIEVPKDSGIDTVTAFPSTSYRKNHITAIIVLILNLIILVLWEH